MSSIKFASMEAQVCKIIDAKKNGIATTLQLSKLMITANGVPLHITHFSITTKVV